MATKVTKYIGSQVNMPAGVTADFALPNAFDNWISTQDLVAQDIWVEALICQNFASDDIANMEMHPLTYDATHYCIVKPLPGRGVNDLDPTGALNYGTVGVELVLQVAPTARMFIGCGVVVEGFRVKFVNATAPSTSGQAGLRIGRKENSAAFPNTVPGAFRRNRVLCEIINSVNPMIDIGTFAGLGEVTDNTFFQDTGTAAFVKNVSNSTVSRNTFVRRGTSVGNRAIDSAALAPVVKDNVFVGCGGVPLVLNGDSSTAVTNNYTDTAITNGQPGLTYGASLVISSTDVRPVSGGVLINNGSASAEGTYDIRGTFRGQIPDVGAVQLSASAPAPTGTITTQVVDGQTVTANFSTTNSPTSGMATLRAAVINPQGAVDQADQVPTFGGGVGSVSFAAVPPGNYELNITVSNASGFGVVSGTTPVSILGADGGGTPELPDAPPPQLVGTSYPVAYDVNGAVRRAFNIEYSVSNLVRAVSALAYSVAGAVRKSFSVAYDVDPAPTDVPLFLTPSAARTVTVVPNNTTRPFEAGEFWDMGNPKKPKGLKDPHSKIEVTFDWSQWLVDSGDTLEQTGVEFFTSGGLVRVGISLTNTALATVMLSGGTLGSKAPVTCRITTSSAPPRIAEATVFLKIEER